jgi:hypothetical protein
LGAYLGFQLNSTTADDSLSSFMLLLKLEYLLVWHSKLELIDKFGPEVLIALLINQHDCLYNLEIGNAENHPSIHSSIHPFIIHSSIHSSIHPSIHLM